MPNVIWVASLGQRKTFWPSKMAGTRTLYFEYNKSSCHVTAMTLFSRCQTVTPSGVILFIIYVSAPFISLYFWSLHSLLTFVYWMLIPYHSRSVVCPPRASAINKQVIPRFGDQRSMGSYWLQEKGHSAALLLPDDHYYSEMYTTMHVYTATQ